MEPLESKDEIAIVCLVQRVSACQPDQARADVHASRTCTSVARARLRVWRAYGLVDFQSPGEALPMVAPPNNHPLLLIIDMWSTTAETNHGI